MLVAMSKDILLFEPLSWRKWIWTFLSLTLLWMVTDGSIVNKKICLPVKWTYVPIFFESARICIKRTHGVTGTLCGGC